MKKNGFTLVELLAVIGVLSVLTLIAIPTIDSIIKKNREKLYQSQILTIKNGMKTWSTGNIDVLPINEGEVLTLDLGFFKATGYIDLNITNPINGKCFPNDMVLMIKKISNNYEYIVDEDSGTETSKDCKLVLPEGNDIFAFFIGSENTTIYVGDEYKDSGIIVVDKSGAKLDVSIEKTLKDSNNNIVTKIDTTKEGIYYINYNYTAKRDNNIVKTGTMIRNLIIEPKEVELIYKEAILKGAYPEILNNMIPVTIDKNGNVYKADIEKEWYSYSKKEWANAVIVDNDFNHNIDTNELINKENILAYFVWIPRYKYAIPNGNAERSIDIKFEGKMYNKTLGNAIGNNYRTHPAFTFGEEELNGFWVGKFETSNTQNNPKILPNVPSLRNLSISQQFISAQKFKTIIGAGDSRVIKNSEWGATAYLSHSIYGINKEVRINNNSNFLTGCGANVTNASASNSCQIEYGKFEEYPQSTTGNISGIFDMSGGTWELTMLSFGPSIAGS